jgi:hypothetical protein
MSGSNCAVDGFLIDFCSGEMKEGLEMIRNLEEQMNEEEERSKQLRCVV